MKVAYIPYKGYNYEDSTIISETAGSETGSLILRAAEAGTPASYITLDGSTTSVNIAKTIENRICGICQKNTIAS